jgi:hypothetical protein
MPDLVPAVGAAYAVDPSAIGRDFEPPADGMLRWEPVESKDGRVDPPPWTWWRERTGKGRDAKAVVKRSDKPGRADCVWYAATEVVSPSGGKVWVGLDAADHAKLWVNRNLTWVDCEREWGWQASGPAVIPVTLRKGVNRLLVRCRDDRGGSHFSLRFCTRGRPIGSAPARATGEKPLTGSLRTAAQRSWPFLNIAA